MSLGWYSTSNVPQLGWTCGYCGKEVGGNVGYHREGLGGGRDDYSKIIYICPHCENPTVFITQEDEPTLQVPGAPYGNKVASLPDNVAAVYAEIRRCVQYTAYTSAVLSMRNLLSHVAVDLGADENRSFAYYVTSLDEQHYIPPNARAWVDTLRQFGNEATHELSIVGEADAKLLLDFAEMLLRIVYEFPAKNVRR